MTVGVAKKLQDAGWDPLGLHSDCHRRIERFLERLIVISEQARGQALSDLPRQQFDFALSYFCDAAAKHTLDEEVSLLPRLRRRHSESQAVFALLDRLHGDHTEAEIRRRTLGRLGRAWLADERLSPDNTRLFISLLEDLRTTYEKHIAVENIELFPIAERILDPAELKSMAHEMAARRGLVI